jgi:hypothetical protein
VKLAKATILGLSTRKRYADPVFYADLRALWLPILKMQKATPKDGLSA